MDIRPTDFDLTHADTEVFVSLGSKETVIVVKINEGDGFLRLHFPRTGFKITALDKAAPTRICEAITVHEKHKNMLRNKELSRFPNQRRLYASITSLLHNPSLMPDATSLTAPSSHVFTSILPLANITSKLIHLNLESSQCFRPRVTCEIKAILASHPRHRRHKPSLALLCCSRIKRRPHAHRAAPPSRECCLSPRRSHCISRSKHA